MPYKPAKVRLLSSFRPPTTTIAIVFPVFSTSKRPSLKKTITTTIVIPIFSTTKRPNLKENIMAVQRSRFATVFSELASEQKRQQQVWDDYCSQGLALSSSGAASSGEEEWKAFFSTCRLASKVTESVLGVDLNQHQDSLVAESMNTIDVNNMLENVLEGVIQDCPKKAPPRPPRKSYRSFEVESCSFEEELALVAARPDLYDVVDQGIEDLLFVVGETDTTESGDSSSTASSSRISDLVLDDLTPWLPFQNFLQQSPMQPSSINSWLAELPGGDSTQESTGKTLAQRPQVYATPSLYSVATSNSPETLHSYGAGFDFTHAHRRHLTRLSDFLGQELASTSNRDAVSMDLESYIAPTYPQRQTSQPSSPFSWQLEFDNQSQPDLHPSYFLPAQYRDLPTDLIEANIADPRRFASQVPNLLQPIPDLADQMGLVGLGISFDPAGDPILANAPTAPRAMLGNPDFVRPCAAKRYLARQQRHRQFAYFNQANIDAREVNLVKSQMAQY